MTHMKTTIELSDGLFAAVKEAAVRRRTTMKAMIEHALRREIAFNEKSNADAVVEVNTHGFPVLKKREGVSVTSERVYQMIEEEGI